MRVQISKINTCFKAFKFPGKQSYILYINLPASFLSISTPLQLCLQLKGNEAKGRTKLILPCPPLPQTPTYIG